MKNFWLIFVILLLGFFVRVAFTAHSLKISGDLLAQAEWGRKFWELGPKNFYSSRYYLLTPPTYPPLSNLIYAGAFWANENRIVLAKINNIAGVIPTSFLIFLDKTDPDIPYLFNYGYFLILKLPVILADLAISLFIYRVVLEITKNRNKAWLGFLLYLFNPITIFLSGVWGQTESLVALPAILSFYFTYRRKFYLSFPLFFISLYLKPTWILLTPLYLFSLYVYKPKGIILGLSVAILIYLSSTWVFSGKEIFPFTARMISSNISPFAKGVSRFSVTAFNVYSVFFGVEKDTSTSVSTIASLIPYIFLNYISFRRLVKGGRKDLTNLLGSIFIVGMGSFLFMTSMLERYFFPALIPMIILAAMNIRRFWSVILVQVILFINLYWSFYRRSDVFLNNLFLSNNLLLIRALSFVNVAAFIYLISKPPRSVLQLNNRGLPLKRG